MMFLHVLLLFCACPPSTAKGRLRKFYIVQGEFNRKDALNECKTNYTDLVTVYDQEDNMDLKSTLKKYVASNPSGWIGAHLGNRSKKWSNGDEVTYEVFKSNCEETCCATINYDGFWKHHSCEEGKPFMCYKQDVGRASYNYAFIRENKTWFEAQLYCRENHTDLVSIRNETENEQVKKELGNNEDFCWIGLLEDRVEWSDGGQSAYRDWSPASQHKIGSDVFMTAVNNAGWIQTNTSTYHPLCYKSFIHVSKDKFSWEEALDHCNTSGLLRIESEDDQIETERELKRKNISEPVWIGLRQSRLFGFWIWSNGVSVGPWTNWKGGSAPEHQISQHCGALEKLDRTFKWTDKDCKSAFKVLCEGK